MRRVAFSLILVVTCSLLTRTGGAEAASGDYIVMLREGVNLQAHLKVLKPPASQSRRGQLLTFVLEANEAHRCSI